MQGVLPNLPGAKKQKSKSPKLQPAKPHNRKHDLDTESELTVNDLYEQSKRQPQPFDPFTPAKVVSSSPSPRHKGLVEKHAKNGQESSTTASSSDTKHVEHTFSSNSDTNELTNANGAAPLAMTLSVNQVEPSSSSYDNGHSIAEPESVTVDPLTSQFHAVAATVDPDIEVEIVSPILPIKPETAKSIETSNSTNTAAAETLKNKSQDSQLPGATVTTRTPDINTTAEKNASKSMPVKSKENDDQSNMNPSKGACASESAQNIKLTKPQSESGHNDTINSNTSEADTVTPATQAVAAPATSAAPSANTVNTSEPVKAATPISIAVDPPKIQIETKVSIDTAFTERTDSKQSDNGAPSTKPGNLKSGTGPINVQSVNTTGKKSSVQDTDSPKTVRTDDSVSLNEKTSNLVLQERVPSHVRASFDVSTTKSETTNGEISQVQNRSISFDVISAAEFDVKPDEHSPITVPFEQSKKVDNDMSKITGSSGVSGRFNRMSQRMSVKNANITLTEPDLQNQSRSSNRKSIIGTQSTRKSRLGNSPDESNWQSSSSTPRNMKKSILVTTRGAETAAISMQDKDIEMHDLVQDKERRDKLEAMVPSLKQTLEAVETRIENSLEAGISVIEFRPHLIQWLCDLINGMAGGQISDPDNYNPDGLSVSASDDEQDADLDLFEDNERMANVEKMLPSIRPMYDEIRRKSSIRRETATKMVEFHVSLRVWVSCAVEAVAKDIVDGRAAQREKDISQPNQGSF